MREGVFTGRAAVIRLASFAGIALLAACQTVPPPTPVAPPPPSPPPPVIMPAPPALDPPPKPWDVAPLSEGDWHYRQDGAQTMAWFGPSEANIVLTLSCNKASRQISLSRSGTAGGPATMTVRTSFGDLAWSATPSAGAFAEMIVTRPAADTGFDWIAFSRGRLSVELPSLPRLIAPAWADVSRVIEDCRG